MKQELDWNSFITAVITKSYLKEQKLYVERSFDGGQNTVYG